MKIKINIETEYELPEEFKLDEERQIIIYKNNTNKPYAPAINVQFMTLEKDSDDECGPMPEDIKKRIEECFRGGSTTMKMYGTIE